MSNHESTILAKVRMIGSAKGWRLFRNSVGLAWTGNITEECTLKDRNGLSVHVVELANARRVNYGLVKGSSDLIGWTPVQITENMIGQTVAVFTSVECKTKAYGKISEEQKNWLDQVAAAGGMALVAKEQKNGEVELIKIEKS